jgi:hypothetical protein
MQRHVGAALALAVVSIVGCDRSTLLQPSPTSPAAVAQAGTQPANAAVVPSGKPEIDPTYANDTTVYMIGPHLVVDARTTMPNAYEHAEELYLVVFPQDSTPAPGAGPITLASGYRPQCNPCFHPGLPPPFVYHDHVITGAPGMGNNGTAGQYKGPWKIILVMYDPAYAASSTFKPLTSAAAIDAAEQAGKMLLPFNKGAANPYEFETGNLLICPTVSNHA